MFGFFIAALLVVICQNCKGAPVDAGELNEKELVEELQSQEGIISLRAFKESVSKSEDGETAWLSQLAEDMNRDSLSPNYNQKLDLLYENHTDLNRPLKFYNIKLNCGKDFNIFRLLEQVKAHRKPLDEGTPKCVECLLEDATCTTTPICTTPSLCTTACPTTCPKSDANGAPRKSTSKPMASKKREPMRHVQDSQHAKSDQIMKLVSKQDNQSNNSHGRRIPEGQGSKPGIQHFDPFPEKFDPFSQWKTAMASKLRTDNDQAPGPININSSNVERLNFVEPRKNEQNLKEPRIEDQNGMPSKGIEENIPSPNVGIQSLATSKVDQNTLSSKVESQNLLDSNTGVGVSNSGVQILVPPNQIEGQNVLVKNLGFQNPLALNVDEPHIITLSKAEAQCPESTQRSNPIIPAAKSLSHNSVIPQAVYQSAKAPKAESFVSVAPKTSEKKVVVSTAKTCNPPANQEGGLKDMMGEQHWESSKNGGQSCLVPKPGPLDSIVSTTDNQNAIINKVEADDTVGLKGHKTISKMEDHITVSLLEGNTNTFRNKPENQNIDEHKLVESNDLDTKTNVHISKEPIGGALKVIRNKVGDLIGKVQQTEDEHIVEPVSGEQISLGYNLGGGFDNKPSMSEGILPKGGDQNDIAQKAGELFGVVPPNLDAQNVVAPHEANILSPKSEAEGQIISAPKSDDQNLSIKDHNAIAFRAGKRNIMVPNAGVQNTELNTKDLNVNQPRTVYLNDIAPLAGDQHSAFFSKNPNVDFLKKEKQNIMAPQLVYQHIIETNIDEATQIIPLP